MTQHIDIGKIGKEKGNIFLPQFFYDGIRHPGSVHLGLLIEKRNILGGGNGDSLFPGKRLSNLAIQKKAYVDGFFRFGNLDLLQPVAGSKPHSTYPELLPPD